MDIKRLLSQFTYKIEAKPEGGFIAHASDPSVPPLEAPTRAELQMKIQASIASVMAQEFPSLKLPLQNNAVQFAFHVEHKPEGGFVLQSTDGKELPVVGGTHAELENKFAERILGVLGKGLMPELTQALAAQAGGGDVKVVVNRKTVFPTGSTAVSSSGVGPSLTDTGQAANLLNATNAPIMPEPNKLWPFVRFILTALIFAAIIYFVRYR